MKAKIPNRFDRRVGSISFSGEDAAKVAVFLDLKGTLERLESIGLTSMRSLLSGLETMDLVKELLLYLKSFWNTKEPIAVYPYRNAEILVGMSENSDLTAELVQGRKIPAKNYPVANNKIVVSFLDFLYESILEAEQWMKSSDPDEDIEVSESIQFIRDSVKDASGRAMGLKKHIGQPRKRKASESDTIEFPPKFSTVALKNARKNGFYFGRKSQRKGKNKRRPNNLKK